MRLRDFIRQNREEIDRAISRVLNHVPKEAGCSCPRSGTNHDHTDTVRIDDEERRLWILNDEGSTTGPRVRG